MRSYASIRKGLAERFSDLRLLTGEKTRDIPATVAGLIGTIREAERSAKTHLAMDLKGLKMLEIGVGQRPLRLKYFTVANDAVGIDYDPVPQGFDPGAYWQILSSGDLYRFVKTLGRKALGVDRRSTRELARQTGLLLPKRARILRADGAHLPFADGSFDFIYSFSVFEHLSEPLACLREAARVLRPGGGFYILVHHYTSEDGAHDMRILSGHRSELPYWAHLRPKYAALVRPNAYLNKLGLGEWESMFRAECPGVIFEYPEEARTGWSRKLSGELKRLRESGELKDYTDLELLSAGVAAIWKKPSR